MTNIHLLSYLAQFYLERETFQTKVVQEIKNTFCIQHFFFRNSCPFLHNVGNDAQQDRPQKIIWRMCIACWINKGTDTHSEYVTLIAIWRMCTACWINKCSDTHSEYVTLIAIWRMCTACWIDKSSDTNSEYVTLTAFPL